MNLRAAVILPLVLIVLPAVSDARATEENRPGLLKRTWTSATNAWAHTTRLFHFGSRGDGGGKINANENRASVRVKDLTLSMELAPLPLDLSESRQLKVTLSLLNHSKRYVHLEFPTTQRIEILIRDNARNKLVTQWSEDQAFSNEPAYVTINPGERVEYHAAVSTRDLAAGHAYTVEAFFPNFDKLTIQQTIVPEK